MKLRKVTLCYLIRNGEILLAEKKRGFGIGKLNGVGGKKEPGETVKEAAIRETQEEIDVKIQDFQHVAILNFSTIGSLDQNDHHKVYVYFATSWLGEPKETEEMNPRWVKLNQIPFDLMWPVDIMWLPLTLSGKKLLADFTFDINNQLIEHQIKVVDNIPNL